MLCVLRFIGAVCFRELSHPKALPVVSLVFGREKPGEINQLPQPLLRQTLEQRFQRRNRVHAIISIHGRADEGREKLPSALESGCADNILTINSTAWPINYPENRRPGKMHLLLEHCSVALIPSSRCPDQLEMPIPAPVRPGFRSVSTMLNQDLKNEVFSRVLPRVRTPAQYAGGELNSVVKDHKAARGTVCLAFPDTYSLGMSHHGLQVLYSLMNEAGWACERVFTPLPDFESALKEAGLPLYSSRDVHAALPGSTCSGFRSSMRSVTRTC